MSDEEIRRRKTTDREMDALVVITQALADLDVQTCKRILTWAEERFVKAPPERAYAGWVDNVNKQIQWLKQRAKDLGVDERALMHGLSHERDIKRLAPVDIDPSAEGTEEAFIARLGGE